MSNTNRTAVVAEYLDFAREDKLDDATNYLQECFDLSSTDSEVKAKEEIRLQEFMEEVVAAAQVEDSAEAEATTQAEVAEDNAEVACDATADTEVQEATSES